MKYLKIQNDGLLDIRLVALMGGTTKASDKYKIGQFGTGLKYTLAYLFRNNLVFKIFVGETEVEVGLDQEDIRGDIFEIIKINGQRTSITTKMGEDWSAWMIIREMWCNALDEGGAAREITMDAIGSPNKTTFFVQVSKEIEDVLHNWNKYFIHEQEPIWGNETYKLYPAGDKMCIYKQGVLIAEEDRKSVFSYDIGNASINELREFRGNTEYEVYYALRDASEKAVSYFLENISEEHFEGNMSWDWYSGFGKTWKEVIGSGKIIYKKVYDDVVARGADIDLTGIIMVPKKLYQALTKQFPGIGAVYVAGVIGDFYEQKDEAVELQIKKGLAILETCGYDFHPELKFVYGYFEDKTVLAKVDLKSKKVYVSKAFATQPLSSLVSMLIEENEHFNTGFGDRTREFQQHFINLYTKQLLQTQSIEI